MSALSNDCEVGDSLSPTLKKPNVKRLFNTKYFNMNEIYSARELIIDRKKISYCNLNNIQIRSYDLSHDAIDIILDVQEILDKS